MLLGNFSKVSFIILFSANVILSPPFVTRCNLNVQFSFDNATVFNVC